MQRAACLKTINIKTWTSQSDQINKMKALFYQFIKQNLLGV